MAEGRDERQEADIQVYDKHWFTRRETALQYRCGKCENVFKDPWQIVKCGHQFCRSCLPNPVKKCPTCDRDVKPNEVFPDEAAKKKVLALQMRCPARRCNWKGTLQHFIERHKKNCPSDLVQCSNEACKKTVARGELAKHLEEECQLREIDCRYECGNRITIADEQIHYEEECQQIPVDCPQSCASQIPRGKIQQHIDEECQKTLIDCTFKTVGCEAKVERGKLREHEVDMMLEHLSQAVHVINNLEQEKQQMSEDIRLLEDTNNNLTQELRDFNEQEEVRINRIDSDLQEFKEDGTIRLEGVQRAAEQNFDILSATVQQNNDFQQTLLYIQQELENLKITIIPQIQVMCVSHQKMNKTLSENQEKLQKMIVAVHNKFKSALASLREEMDTELDTLRKANEEERTARLEHEAEIAEEISKLNEDISEDRSKLEKVKMGLTITQDEMKEGFSEHCKQMQLDYDNLSHVIEKEKQSRENDFVQLREEMSEMNSINTGVLIWRVKNVDAKLECVQSKAKSLHGQAFYSEPYGYLLQPKVFFNGARLNDQGYISIFIQIVQGPFDPILKWPFGKRIRFTLIEQESKRIKRDIEKILVPAADADELRRPSDDVNNGFGIYKFVSHEVLRAGRYIVDDVMFVKIEVLQDIEEHGHSETL